MYLWWSKVLLWKRKLLNQNMKRFFTKNIHLSYPSRYSWLAGHLHFRLHAVEKKGSFGFCTLLLEFILVARNSINKLTLHLLHVCKQIREMWSDYLAQLQNVGQIFWLYSLGRLSSSDWWDVEPLNHIASTDKPLTHQATKICTPILFFKMLTLTDESSSHQATKICTLSCSLNLCL